MRSRPRAASISSVIAWLNRVRAALAADPEVMRKTGLCLHVGDLAREYGFTDIDGRQPERFLID